MSEIDVNNCAFYNNGKCDNPNGMACNCCNNVDCYYKQLLQLMQENEDLKKLNEQLITYYPQENNELLKVKLENEELKKTINKLGIKHENYNNLLYWQMKEQQDKLKVENEKLKQDLQKESDLGHKAICEEADSFFEAMKLQKVLDEIEGIVEQYSNNGIELSVEKQEQILQLIKQARED